MIKVKICSISYWFIFSILGIFLISITIYFGFLLRQKHAKRVSLNIAYQVSFTNQKMLFTCFFQDGEIIWDKWNTIAYPFIFFSSGFVAGLLGIGGGMIAGPLLLEVGLSIPVATATSAFMIVCLLFFF